MCFAFRLRARRPRKFACRKAPICRSAYERVRFVSREPSRRAASSSSLKSQFRSFTPPVSGHAAGAVNDGVSSTHARCGRALEPDPAVGNRNRFQEVTGSVRRVGRTNGNGRRPEGRPPPDFNELSGTGRSGVITTPDPHIRAQRPDAFSGATILRRLSLGTGGLGPRRIPLQSSSALSSCGSCQPPPRRSPKRSGLRRNATTWLFA